MIEGRTYFPGNLEVIPDRLIYTTFTFIGLYAEMMKRFGRSEVTVPIQKYRPIALFEDGTRKNIPIEKLRFMYPYYQVWIMQ